MRWNKSEIATQSQDSILISISVGTISRDMLQFCMKPIEIKLSSSTFGLSEMSYFKDIIRLFLIAVYESMPSAPHTVYKFIVIKVKCGMWMANCRSTLAVGNEQL